MENKCFNKYLEVGGGVFLELVLREVLQVSVGGGDGGRGVLGGAQAGGRQVLARFFFNITNNYHHNFLADICNIQK